MIGSEIEVSVEQLLCLLREKATNFVLICFGCPSVFSSLVHILTNLNMYNYLVLYEVQSLFPTVTWSPILAL